LADSGGGGAHERRWGSGRGRACGSVADARSTPWAGLTLPSRRGRGGGRPCGRAGSSPPPCGRAHRAAAVPCESCRPRDYHDAAPALQRPPPHLREQSTTSSAHSSIDCSTSFLCTVNSRARPRPPPPWTAYATCARALVVRLPRSTTRIGCAPAAAPCTIALPSASATTGRATSRRAGWRRRRGRRAKLSGWAKAGGARPPPPLPSTSASRLAVGSWRCPGRGGGTV
jgi:hypothetical protein